MLIKPKLCVSCFDLSQASMALEEGKTPTVPAGIACLDPNQRHSLFRIVYDLIVRIIKKKGTELKINAP